MLFRPELHAEALAVKVHREVPDVWPAAARPSMARCHIFQMREFIEAWQASFGRSARFTPLYVEVRDGKGETLLLLPLVIERRAGVRVLTFLDQGHADYNAPVLFPAVGEHLGQFTPAFWRDLLGALPPFDLARLEKMPEDVLDLPNPLHELANGRNDGFCHGNNLERPWAEVEAVLLSPKELKSKQRSLEKIAPVTFLVAEDESTRQRLLNKLVEQKQRRFEETRVPGFGENPDALAFLHAASTAFAAGGNLFICALLVGDEITAVQWGLSQDNRLYALMTGFESGKWMKFSCGRVLNLRLLHWLHERGFSYLDQGFGDEAYKLQNCDTTVPLSKAVFGQTALGRLHLARTELTGRLRASPAGERLRQLKWVVRRRLWPTSIDKSASSNG